MSTRCTVVTCAEVRLLITMCSAIFCRITDIGSVRVFADSASGIGCAGGACCGGSCGVGSTGYGPAALATGCGGGGGPEGAAYVRPACDDICASTSCLVIRPPAPVPFT